MTTVTSVPQREWIEVPTWAVPVWVTLDGAAVPSDPLTDAIMALVKVGLDKEPKLAAQLSMPPPLVEAAADLLVAQGLLLRTEHGSLKVVDTAKTGGHEATVSTRPGWVCWDPQHDRPILQLYLDDGPPGRDLREGGAVQDHPPPPTLGRLEPALRLLALVGGLQVLEPRGELGAHLLDSARVRALQLRGSGRAKRSSAWVAVEHRVSGSVVWRPTVARVEDDLGELDPVGWQGLLERCGDRVQVLEKARSAFQSDRIAPLLAEAGFDSLDALRKAAREECGRELAGVGEARGWGRTRAAIEQALVDQYLAAAMDADWRQQARGWADAIEALTGEAISSARTVVEQLERMPTLTAEAQGTLSRLTGPSWEIVRRCSTRRSDFRTLRDKLLRGEESAGHRLAALAIAAAADRSIRASLLDADRELLSLFPESKGLFAMLDAAREERNTITHDRRRAEEVDVRAMRARVFALARALMGSGVGG